MNDTKEENDIADLLKMTIFQLTN